MNDKEKARELSQNRYSTVVASFDKTVDIKRAPIRAKIYSYAKNTSFPILFRHYKHTHYVSDSGEYSFAAQNWCRLWIFIEGKFDLIIEDKLYSLTCGNVIIIREGESYSSIFRERTNADYYEIDFPPEFFDTLPDVSPFHTLFDRREGCGSNCISLDGAAMTKMFQMLEKIESIIENGQKHSDFLIYSRLIQLAALASDSFDESKISEHKLSPTLRSALRYISENYLTLDDTSKIAEHCRISVSYLCRLFKNSLGATPVEYINSKKLSHAKYMLKNGYNVTEACYGSGFNSYNYFISTFKKTVGQTPTEYKRSEN